MKKGFTLIELLAVIVILAVISLITIPMLLNVVEESRKGAFKATCNEIYNAYENYKIKEEIKGESNIDVIFDFNSGRTETEIINGIKYEPISKLSLKGELPKFGTYEIKDGQRELVIDNGVYTCVRNENRNDILDGAVADNDLTPPITRDIILSSTTRSIKVIVDGYEEDGLITKYYYQINDLEVIESEESIYVFDNLNTKEEYEIKVYVENKSGLKSEVLSKKIETKEISGTTYEESSNQEEFEYATSKVVEIKYDIQEGLSYYLKTDVEAESVNGIIEECGSETTPGSCTSTSVTTLEANKWYRTSSSTTSILFKQEGNIYTIVSDGKNKTEENTYQVVKVTDETPTTPVITGGSDTWSNEAKTISVENESTGAGGVHHYQYCMSTVVSECDGTWIDLDAGVTSILVSTNGTNYVFFKAIGKNGKVSEISNYQTTKIDTSNPTVTVSVSGKVATFTIKDNIGTVGYGVNQSTTSEPSYTAYATTSGTRTWTASAAGTYQVWVKDNAGRTARAQFTIASTAFCAYSAGQVWNYAYTGGVQSFAVPCSGTYKLEVWGAQGGSITYLTTGTGGYGGYSYGNKALTSGSTLYIVVGGAGGGGTVNSSVTTTTYAGGYNGGGTGYYYFNAGTAGWGGAGGGGATHIALSQGLILSSTTKSNLLIVAGGGGGGASSDNNSPSVGYSGGTGGGTTGGSGTASYYNGLGGSSSVGGSSQAGVGGSGSYGRGGTGGLSTNGTVGYGGAGGGAGLYGGGGASYDGSGGGGSGYIGGVTGGSMSNGQRSGHGYARITLVSISS